jgi:hypothetical protein
VSSFLGYVRWWPDLELQAVALMIGRSMKAGSDLGLAGLDLGSRVFLLLKIDF